MIELWFGLTVGYQAVGWMGGCLAVDSALERQQESC